MNYKVTKVKIKDRSLTVDMDETVSGADYSFTNEVTKKCASLAHDDLLKALEIDKKGKLKRSKKIKASEEAAA